jgi:hypothetical protein
MKKELPRDGDKKELDARNSVEGLGDVSLCEVRSNSVCSQCVQFLVCADR